MRGRLLARILTPLSVAGLFAIGVCGQVALARSRADGLPAMGESVAGALGGFRSLAAEFVWYRAERLESAGRYGELVQLASLLTWLEPHDAGVWTYASWNMAYNISRRMPRLEDRWRWVRAGIDLIRDEGLRWNPGDPDICRELALMFETKIGVDANDAAAALYRAEWRRIVEDVAARGAWTEIGLDVARKAGIERRYGVTDWTNPQAYALYWAELGLEKADDRQRPWLNEIRRQSLVLYSRSASPLPQGATF